MTENKTISDCTIYAFVGTAILAISLVVAMYVGNDFHQNLWFFCNLVEEDMF